MIESITAKNLSHELILSRIAKIVDSDSVYWQSGNEKLNSRPMAFRRLSEGHATKFVLNDNTWSLYNWLTPQQNLYQLYIDHAKHIRSKYDFVRVAYSGGVDSHTILTAFRDAGVAPDEIFFWTYLDTDSCSSPTNYEIHRSVVPHLATIKKWFPGVKISQLNFDINQLAVLKSLPITLNPFCTYSAGIRIMPTSMALCCFEQFDEVNSITLTGSDKPRIDRINGNWYSYIIDAACYDTWGRTVQGFYLNPDPTIHIAQSHAIKNLIESHQLSSRLEILKFQNSTDKNVRCSINSTIERSVPFDDIVVVGKKTVRQYQDQTEHQPKVYLLNRQLRKTEQGRAVIENWQQSKQDFLNYTGYEHSTGIFGSFYNLENGQAYTVDQLFPNGWNLND